MKITDQARQRRHTLHFLGELPAFSPVFLDTEVDMSEVCRHRAEATALGRRYSVVSYVIRAAVDGLLAHPDANVALRGRSVARFDEVRPKLALDKTVGGHRVVVSAVLDDLRSADLDAIQAQVDHYRDADPDTSPEFAGLRLLHRLPGPLGRLAFRLGVRPLARRAAVMGTVAVSSLGHRPVDGFHSIGGTTITLGVGRVADRPVVRDGVVTIAPVMRLNMTFDHRAVDGALAADLLADIASALREFPRHELEPEQGQDDPGRHDGVNGRPAPGRATENADR